MSRRTPPAPIAASCWSSPTRRTDPPLPVTKSATAARERVSAIPASSMTTRVSGPMRWAQSGRSSWSMDQVSLARVSVPAPSCSRRTAAAAADGASPMTVPPSVLHAAARAAMAVVFPAPAGAIASCTRAPEVAMPVTSAACPALRLTPLAACSSNAIATASALAVCPSRRPARATRRCSAARIAGEVNRADPATSYMLVPSRRRSSVGSRTSSRAWVILTDPSVRTSSTSRSTTASTRSAGRSAARTRRCASARTCQTCHVERALCRVSPMVAAVARTHAESTAGEAGPAVGDRAPVTIAATACGPPRTSRASRAQAVRCSWRVRGSCLASRVSRVACWARWMDSMTVGGRPWSAWNAVASSVRRAWIESRLVDHRWLRRGSTPTTSRTPRLSRSAPGRSAKVSPSRARRCFSMAVL